MDTFHQILELELIKRYDRPVFEYDEILYLYDTGSDTPVWCSGEEMFVNTFKNAKKTDYKVYISGFGEGYTTASAYVIPRFYLKRAGIEYKIDNLYVAVTDYHSLNFDFILSNTMFAKTDNVIANSKNLLQVHIYGDRPYICTPFLVGDEMTKISVWAN